MRANDVEYFAPAVFDDEIEVFVRVSRLGATSVTFEFAAYRVRDDVLMVTAHQTAVYVDLADRKKCPLPAEFRETIVAFEGDDVEPSDALAAVEAIVEQGGDVDDVLRQVVAALHEHGGCAWAGLFFVEDGALALGPEAGTPDEAGRVRVPVLWQGVEVAELAVDGAPADDDRIARAGGGARLRPLPRRLGHRRRALGVVNPVEAARPAGVLSTAGRRSCCALSPLSL